MFVSIKSLYSDCYYFQGCDPKSIAKLLELDRTLEHGGKSFIVDKTFRLPFLELFHRVFGPESRTREKLFKYLKFSDVVQEIDEITNIHTVSYKMPTGLKVPGFPRHCNVVTKHETTESTGTYRIVKATTNIPGIRYGDCFYTESRYYVTWDSPSKSR